MFEWSRSNTLALAASRCVHCKGMGLKRLKRVEENRPCKCVLRAIFRICFKRFRDCVERDKRVSHAQQVGNTWSRVTEEYIADFHLMAKRTLSGLEWDVFRFHFLLGADWKLCCYRLKLDKGNFFHAVYRVEEMLGRAFAETQPYGLYPLDEYFGTVVRKAPRTIGPDPSAPNVIPIRPPLRTNATPIPLAA